MYPTLDNDDVLLVVKTKKVDYGDIVVIKMDDNKFFVKRVIAVEGDKVDVVDSDVKVNGADIKEVYAYYDDTDAPLTSVTCVVPSDSLFIMGDNRKASYDSRRMGPVSVDQVVGKSVLDITALCGINQDQFKSICSMIFIVSFVLLIFSHTDKKKVKTTHKMITPIHTQEIEHVDFDDEKG